MDLRRKRQSSEVIRTHVLQQQRKVKPWRFIGFFALIQVARLRNNRNNHRKVEVTPVGRALRPPKTALAARSDRAECLFAGLLKISFHGVNLGGAQRSDPLRRRCLLQIVTGFCLLLASEFLANRRIVSFICIAFCD